MSGGKYAVTQDNYLAWADHVMRCYLCHWDKQSVTNGSNNVIKTRSVSYVM
jgi:hypothetical protein